MKRGAERIFRHIIQNDSLRDLVLSPSTPHR